MENKVNLGDECEDTVTGFNGVAVAITQWLNGCVRVTLQPRMAKDGKVPESITFDAPQLKVLKAKKVDQGPRNTGGPIPSPEQKKTPKR